MTPDQFNKALVKLGFARMLPNGQMSKGQTELARELDLGARTVRHWAAGKWPVPVNIAKLLNLMLDTKSSAKDLR
jgi:hypothetical protein